MSDGQAVGTGSRMTEALAEELTDDRETPTSGFNSTR